MWHPVQIRSSSGIPWYTSEHCCVCQMSDLRCGRTTTGITMWRATGSSLSGDVLSSWSTHRDCCSLLRRRRGVKPALLERLEGYSKILQVQAPTMSEEVSQIWCPLMPFEALLLTVWTCWQRLTEALPMTSRALFAPFRFSCEGCYECLEGPSCLYNRLASELPQQGRDEGNKLSAPVIQQISCHVLLVFSETSLHCVASCASCKATLWYSWPIDHLQMMKRKLLKLFIIWILNISTYSWWEVGKRWERSGKEVGRRNSLRCSPQQSETVNF